MERKERAAWFDEALPLIRRFWTEDTVDHDGPRFHYEGLRVLPKPAQQPPDVWLGGIAPSELRARRPPGRRVAPVVRATRRRRRRAQGGRRDGRRGHGRTIDPEHFGVLIPYALGPLPASFAAVFGKRRPDLADPAVLVPNGMAALQDRIEAFVDAGFSKFVVLPIAEPDPDAVPDHLAWLADNVLGLQN